MLKNSVLALSKDYDDDTEIVVRCRDKKTRDLIEYLFP